MYETRLGAQAPLAQHPLTPELGTTSVYGKLKLLHLDLSLDCCLFQLLPGLGPAEWSCVNMLSQLICPPQDAWSFCTKIFEAPRLSRGLVLGFWGRRPCIRCPRPWTMLHLHPTSPLALQKKTSGRSLPSQQNPIPAPSLPFPPSPCPCLS